MNEPTIDYICSRVLDRLQHDGTPMDDLSQVCGVSRTTFNKIRHGRGDVQLSTIWSLCAYAGLRLKAEPY